jgi:hypothetical protein
MKHTKKQRLAMADALEAALPYLWDGVSSNGAEACICNALTETGRPAYREAQDEIMRRLGCSITVRGWLKKRGYTEWRDSPAVQAYRRRWMLALIEEFRS